MLVRLRQKVNEQINYFSNIQRDYLKSIHLFFSNIFGLLLRLLRNKSTGF